MEDQEVVAFTEVTLKWVLTGDYEFAWWRRGKEIICKDVALG